MSQCDCVNCGLAVKSFNWQGWGPHLNGEQVVHKAAGMTLNCYRLVIKQQSVTGDAVEMVKVHFIFLFKCQQTQSRGLIYKTGVVKVCMPIKAKKYAWKKTKKERNIKYTHLDAFPVWITISLSTRVLWWAPHCAKNTYQLVNANPSWILIHTLFLEEQRYQHNKANILLMQQTASFTTLDL